MPEYVSFGSKGRFEKGSKEHIAYLKANGLLEEEKPKKEHKKSKERD